MATTGTHGPVPDEPDECGISPGGPQPAGGNPVIAEVATASAVLLHTSSVTNDTHPAVESDPKALFYHGTDPASALLLVNGTPLSVESALTHRANSASAPGFYLATDPDVAMYFASLHNDRVTMLRYAMTNAVLTSLLSGGATLGPVPRGAAIGLFAGSQLYIPPELFGRFNALVGDGSVSIQPYLLER